MMDREGFRGFFKLMTSALESSQIDQKTFHKVVLDVFSNLSEEDRIILISDGMKSEAVIVSSDAAPIKEEIVTSVEHLNQVEMLRLRTWLFKLIVVSSFICFLIFICLMFYINYISGESNGNWFESTINLFNIILFDES